MVKNVNNGKFDVVIVGGGPAGSTAAYLLKKEGFQVLLIEKEKFPRDKLCGGLITKKTLQILLDLFDFKLKDLKDDNVVDYIADSYRIYFKDKYITRNTMESAFHLVKRTEYDNYLLNKAKASNVKVLENTKVEDINFKDNYITTEKGDRFSGHYIIAADGANSKIRNKLLVKRNLKNCSFVKNNWAMTIEAELPRHKIDLDIKEPALYFGIINWGYGWVFPKKDTITVGLGGLENQNKNFKEIFKDYLKLLNLDHLSLNMKGWPIPYGNYLERPAYKNTFLIGDAGNLVNPLTGEGLYYAHKSAQIVSEVIKKERESNIDCTNLYNKRIKNEIVKDLKKSKFYRSILWSSPQFIQSILVRVTAKYFYRKITRMIQGYELF